MPSKPAFLVRRLGLAEGGGDGFDFREGHLLRLLPVHRDFREKGGRRPGRCAADLGGGLSSGMGNLQNYLGPIGMAGISQIPSTRGCTCRR